MSKALKKLREEERKLETRETSQKFRLIFMDGITEDVVATDFTSAWIKGRIRAAEKKTYLLKVEKIKTGRR